MRWSVACLTKWYGLLHQSFGLFKTRVTLCKNSHGLLSNELQGIQASTDHWLTLRDTERQMQSEEGWEGKGSSANYSSLLKKTIKKQKQNRTDQQNCKFRLHTFIKCCNLNNIILKVCILKTKWIQLKKYELALGLLRSMSAKMNEINTLLTN